jgi:hypothetical protein
MNITRLLLLAGIVSLSCILASCFREADPGPLQLGEKDFAILDFDRIEAGYGLNITIQQGPLFVVHAEGDRRNLSDLVVVKLGTTLHLGFASGATRDHPTYITISMPVLAGANFSGACNVAASGISSTKPIDLTISGATIAQFNLVAKDLTIGLSGASRITLSGTTQTLVAKVSGASELSGFELTAGQADVDASGSSKINVNATQTLKANASGASIIYYRGGAAINFVATGSSSVIPD